MAQKKPNKDDKAQRAQSAELGGGAGFTFEDAVSATFLSALLAEGYRKRLTFSQRAGNAPERRTGWLAWKDSNLQIRQPKSKEPPPTAQEFMQKGLDFGCDRSVSVRADRAFSSIGSRPAGFVAAVGLRW